jgi:MbtH protein
MDGYEDFVVVINAEEQYSIFPAGLDLPPGWAAAGFSGGRQACLDHIAEVWVDMRPKSARDGVSA